jgi:hypothetical protein
MTIACLVTGSAAMCCQVPVTGSKMVCTIGVASEVHVGLGLGLGELCDDQVVVCETCLVPKSGMWKGLVLLGVMGPPGAWGTGE